MTLQINLAGANAANPIGLSPAVTQNLRGIWRFGNTAALTQKNRWRGAAEVAALVGSPTINSTYAAMQSGSNYLQTNILETDAFTLYAVWRSGAAFAAAATRPALGGNHGQSAGQAYGSATFGVTWYVSGTTGLPQATVGAGTSFDNAGVPAQSTVSLSVANASLWRFMAFRQSADGSKVLKDLTAGTSIVGTGTYTRLKNTSNTIRGGSMVSTVASGALDMAFYAIHDAALTDAQDALVYAQEKYRLGLLGITI